MIRNKYLDLVRRKVIRVGYVTLKLDLSEEELKLLKTLADLRNMNIDQFCEMAIEEEMIKVGAMEEEDRKWTHEFIYGT